MKKKIVLLLAGLFLCSMMGTAASQTATKTLTFVINDVLAIITASAPQGTKNVAYSYQLQASGGVKPYTWSIQSGTLPAGLTLSAAGLISGTPTTAGTQDVTFQVKDSSP